MILGGNRPNTTTGIVTVHRADYGQAKLAEYMAGLTIRSAKAFIQTVVGIGQSQQFASAPAKFKDVTAYV